MDLYTATIVLTISFLIVTIIDVATNKTINTKMKKNTVISCVLVSLCAICEWAGDKTNGANPSLIPLHRFAKLTEFSLTPFLGIVAAFSYSKIKHPKTVTAVSFLHVIFELAVLKPELVISIDEANVYHRGPLYFVYIIWFSASIIFCFVNLIREEIENYGKLEPMLIATLVFVAVGVSMQIADSKLLVDFLCVALANYLLYTHRYKMILQMDSLTHVLNRRCFDKDVERLTPVCKIILFDINNFKSINDNYGHSKGDLCLKTVAKQIRNTYSKYGSCYRIGGDEFCVILKKNLEKVDKLNDIFRDRIKELQKDDPIVPNVALGYADYLDKTQDLKTILKVADEKMYADKNTYIR